MTRLNAAGPLLVLALALAWAEPVLAQRRGDAVKPEAIKLVPHRAIYDLKLKETRGKSSIAGVRGRILYDFSGSDCEGYSLQFRQVSELDTGEGKIVVTDLRAATWEEAGAKTYRFTSQNFMDDKLVDHVDGRAERRNSAVRVNLKKPKTKAVNLASGIVFPTDHMRRIIAGARGDKRVIELPLFDGSETGEKVYDTLTLIGQPFAAGGGKTEDASSKEPTLRALARWPVSISYFDQTKTKAGEQTPTYTISFELLENGISRALVLDYNDFVISGEMTRLELKPESKCR